MGEYMRLRKSGIEEKYVSRLAVDFFDRSVFRCLVGLFLLLPLKGFAAYEVDIQLPKSQYIVGISQQDTEVAQKRLESLSAEEQESFLSTRSEFLRLAAIAFQKLKWGFGVGSVIKNKISFYQDKRDIKKHLNIADSLEGDARDTLLSAVLSYEEQLLQRQKAFKEQSFKEKADEVILKMLLSLDRSLWDGAPIVSRANEFGLMFALGPQLETGSAEGKKWGGLLDVGLSLGFNRDQKALIFQIFRDKEKFVSTQMPGIFIAGVVLKAGLMVSNQRKEMTSEGTSFYPPMAPGFSTMTDRSFNVGFSSGLTWPPSPLGDILTYSNSSQRRIWLRASFSPVQKGFVHINEGFSEEVKGVWEMLRRGRTVKSCEALF